MKLEEMPKEQQETQAYKYYMKGVISAEECNKVFKAMGFHLGVVIEYNDNGQDLATGYQKR